jgi:hypothetical protein
MSNMSTMSNINDHIGNPQARRQERDDQSSHLAPPEVRKPYRRPLLEIHDSITALTGDVEIDFGTS